MDSPRTRDNNKNGSKENKPTLKGVRSSMLV